MLIKIAGKSNNGKPRSPRALQREIQEGSRLYEAQEYISKTHGLKASDMSMKEIHERANSDKNKNKSISDIFRKL